MKCQNCGREIKEGASFCGGCGREIAEKTEALNENICPSCGNILAQGAAFCNECGTRLSATAEAFADNRLTCSYCGNILSADVQFCGECGNSVNQPPQRNTASRYNTVKKNDAGLVFLVVLLVVVLFGSAATIGYVYYQNNSISIETPNIDDKTERKKEKKEHKSEKEEADTEKVEETYDTTSPASSVGRYVIEEQEETYLFPSDREYISLSDLYGKSREEVALIRNEIYARHGYIFNTEPFKSYFEAKDWYVPNPLFTVGVFNEIETTNKDFLVNYETEKGWR